MWLEIRRTKIVATIGPATSSHETVRALVEAGMDAARLNISHGTHEDHAAAARSSSARCRQELGRPLALIADLQGPKLRIGSLPEPRMLAHRRAGRRRRRHAARANGELPIAPAVVSEVLRPGHDVLIDDGLVRLRVDELDEGRAVCTVVVGGAGRARTRASTCPGVADPDPVA